MRVAPDRLLVVGEVAAVLCGVALLATAGYVANVVVLERLPAVASFIALAALAGLLLRLALDAPNGWRLFRAWHARTAAELLASATRRRWATSADLATTDLYTTGNGHDPTT